MSSNNGMELNKIAAAILLAGLIGMVAGKASDFLYGDNNPIHHAGHEEKRGYSIEVTDAPAAGGAAAPAGPPDIAALYATADIAKGKEYFGKKCATCHSIEKGGANAIGPNLHGIMGMKIASHGGFNYSDALKAKAGESWSFENMNHWQWNPRDFAKGTIMAYAGNKKDQERANLIAYLNSEGSNLPYPKPKAATEEKPADATATEAEPKK